jgi:hypothetical protein
MHDRGTAAGRPFQSRLVLDVGDRELDAVREQRGGPRAVPHGRPYRFSAPDQQVHQGTAEKPDASVIKNTRPWWQPLVAADPAATGSTTRSD